MIGRVLYLVIYIEEKKEDKAFVLTTAYLVECEFLVDISCKARSTDRAARREGDIMLGL